MSRTLLTFCSWVFWNPELCHPLCAVEGELDVASLVNYFSKVHFLRLVAVHPCPVVLQRYLLTAERSGGSRGEIGGLPQHPAPLPSSFSNPARVSAFVSAIMAPQLNAIQIF